MAILTKNQLSASNASSFPDNTTGAITPAILRNFNTGIIDTLVDSLVTSSYAQTDVSNSFSQPNSFTSISASSFVSASQFVGDGSKLTNITSSISLPILDEGIPQGNATSMNFTGSAISATIVGGTAVVQVNIEGAGFVTTSSFNSFTSSTNQFTQSASSSISQLNASSASQQVSINALNVYTASQSTASIVNSITELNSFTQSQQIYNVAISDKVTALEVATASLFTSVSNLNASSASQQISINALNTNSASVNTSISALNQSSASQQISINSINAASSSWITESETGSFVTTNTVQTISAVKAFNTPIQMVSENYIQFGGFDTNRIGSTGGGRNVNISAISVDGDNTVNITAGGGSSLPNNIINLVTDGSSTTNRIRLQSSNIIITGSTDINGALTASLQQGYVWVGNASGISNAVATSSLQTNVSGFVTTSSFNSYTSSNDQRVSSLEINSASVNTSISNLNSTTASLNTSVNALNTFTASQSTASLVTSIDNLNTFSASALVSISNLNSTTASLNTSASLALVTASFDNGTRNLTFTKGDTQTFSVNIPDVTGSTGNFVTTASFNAYTQSNDQRVSSLEANSASVNTSIANINTTTASLNTSVSNLNSATSSLFTSASLGLTTASISGVNLTFTKGDGTQFTLQTATGSVVSASYAETSSYAQFAQDIYLNVKNTTGAQLNKGTVVRIIGATGDNALIATASWTDDNNSANTLGLLYENIADQDFGKVITQGTLLGINTDPTLGYTAGQLLYLSSSGQYTNVKPPAPYHEVRLGQVLRAQQNNGSMYILIQNGYELEELHDVDINTGSLANNDLLAYNSASAQWENKTVTQVGATTTSSFNAYTSSTNSRLNNIETTTASLNTSVSNLNTFSSSTLVSLSNLNTTTASLLVETSNLETFSASALISLSNLNTATSSLFTSASLTLTTASVNLNTITFTKGDGTTFPITVNTGSGGGGGAAFPYVGDAQISGSLGVTGSFNGFVNNLTISSNTASMDFNNGNFFKLQLVSGSITHLTATNIKPGQTINLLVQTASGSASASGSLTFSPTFKFAGGFDYTPTAITASKDIVSFVTFDTTEIFAGQIKNLS